MDVNDSEDESINEKIASAALMKDKIISMCEELSKLGEESAFLSVNMTSDLAFSTGSVIGQSFLSQQSDIMDLFYKYCKFRYTGPGKSEHLFMTQKIKQEEMTDETNSQDTESDDCPESMKRNDSSMEVPESAEIGQESNGNCISTESLTTKNSEKQSKILAYKNNDNESLSLNHSNNHTENTVDNVESKTDDMDQNMSADETWEITLADTDKTIEKHVTSVDKIKNTHKSKVLQNKIKIDRNTTKRTKSGIKCKVCSVMFYNMNTLKMHMKIHDEKKSFECTICDISIFNEESFRIHMKLHGERRTSRARKATKGNKVSSRRKSSIKNNSNAANDNNSALGHTSNNGKKSSLTKEKNTNVGSDLAIGNLSSNTGLVYKKLIQMTARELGFTNTNSSRDKQLKEKDSPTKSQTSGKRDSVSSNLEEDTVNKTKNNQSITNYLQVVGSSSSHSNTSATQTNLKCSVCSEFFQDSHALKIHMNSHQGKKRFKCNVCGKLLSCQPTHKRHMLLHTGKDSYKCKTCGKGFPMLESLKTHIKTHGITQKSQYICTNCYQGFENETLLYKHWEEVCGKVDMYLDSESSRSMHVHQSELSESIIIPHSGSESSESETEPKESEQGPNAKSFESVKNNNGEKSEADQQVGIMSKFGVELDLSKMKSATEIVFQDPEGKGLCKVCGQEIKGFEQSVVHFTIHMEQQSVSSGKRKKEEKVKIRKRKKIKRNNDGRDLNREAPKSIILENEEVDSSNDGKIEEIKSIELGKKSKKSKVRNRKANTGFDRVEKVGLDIHSSDDGEGSDIGNSGAISFEWEKAETTKNKINPSENSDGLTGKVKKSNKNHDAKLSKKETASAKKDEFEVTLISSDDDEDSDMDKGDDDSNDEFEELLLRKTNTKSVNEESKKNLDSSSKELYTCDICGKVFIDRPSLATHNQKHMTERPFKCDVCGRGFMHKHNLNIHKKIHSSTNNDTEMTDSSSQE